VENEESAGNWEEAAFWAKRAFGLAPDDETVFQRMIGFLDHIGDRAGALREYDKFFRYLEQEFDAEPSAETQELLEAVRSRADANRGSASSSEVAVNLESEAAESMISPLQSADTETVERGTWWRPPRKIGFAIAGAVLVLIAAWLVPPWFSHMASASGGGEEGAPMLGAQTLSLTAEECVEAVRQIHLGGHDRAQIPELLERALELNPQLSRAHAFRSVWFTNLAMSGPPLEILDSAVSEAELAIALDSSDYHAHAALGYARRFSNDRYGQLQPLVRALDLAPDSITPRRMLGLYYNGIGQVSLGSSWWALAVQNPAPSGFRAIQYWYVGDHERAERMQEKVVAATRDGRLWLASFYLTQGKLLEAREQIERALAEADPRTAALLTTGALVEIFAGNWDAARRYLEAALNLEPPALLVAQNGVVTTTLLAYVLLKEGNTEQAQEMLQRSSELDQESLGQRVTFANHHYYDLVRVHAIQGDIAEAIRWLREALDHGWFFAYTYMGLRDPMLETLRGSVEFETMMADARADLDRQREWMIEAETRSEEDLLAELIAQAHADLEELRIARTP
jgi:tetratricopeptide (TPR) repeat protein